MIVTSIDVGNKFETAVFNSIKQIQKNPDRYPKKYNNLREIRIKKFPFLIIYRIDEEEKLIIIQSSFYTSRNPKYKYKR